MWRRLSTEELMLWNCGFEDSWKSVGLQGDPTRGDQPWDFFGRNDAKGETPVLWSPHVKSWLFGKDSDAGKDWGQEEKGTTEDEMAGWHHRLNGLKLEWTPGVGGVGLACCDSWGCKESGMTERLNWLTNWCIMKKKLTCYVPLLLRTKWGNRFKLQHGFWLNKNKQFFLKKKK